ncbi:hypothetical protein AGABI1DRAFT_106125 [Agaricus bisporus var. burnettii JB137-S8]|uniref:Uncharacterized protein n=1 Tax=Agaricus bisporus var. burnettii (strain JB137-S8 / ATCC MYA-4627 / FGSC 10392) TaxID=597362 RepID=K5X957_AGABU|nr:uncharacterized protein AGABI1DRAFT_106125 [Agaricus bisporus var. burnettii JB137-S8]EKM79743.1 hypothetical protein AGABI1DRAFT_106125 [Agaricus bisporus var. burnettii JB137-S8]
MPEYVYALHDFLPENDDEVTFKAGERVEVVEKDDAYGDGWWQGRNLDGKVGLFPVSYTTSVSPAPPADEDDGSQDFNHNKSILNTLVEESESGSPRPADYSSVDSTNHILAPIPKTPPFQLLNGDHDYEPTSPVKSSQSHQLQRGGPDEVMKATLTDVQEAIEQLGQRQHADNDFDGSRSFSFASTRDDRDTDTDFDLSDLDGPNGHTDTATAAGEGEDGVEGWHKNAREKLAAKARKAVEEAEKLEAMMSASDRRMVMPPIEVEVSDESDDEPEEQREDHTTTTSSRIAGIPEEDEGVETDQDPPFMRHGSRNRKERQQGLPAVASPEGAKILPISLDGGVSLDLAEKDDAQPSTATRSAFPSHIRTPSSPFESSTRAQTPQLQRHDTTSAAVSLPPATNTYQNDSTVISVPVSASSNPDQHPFTMRETSTGPRNSLRGSSASSSSAPPQSTTDASFSSNSIHPPVQRSMSPSINVSNTPLTVPILKRASVLSAHSANSGHSIHSTLPPASPEPSSPLPPIPVDIVNTGTQQQHTRISSPASIGNGIVTSTISLGAGGAGGTADNGTLSPISFGEDRTRNGKGEKWKKHPTEWNLDDVVDWLKSKGFDKDNKKSRETFFSIWISICLNPKSSQPPPQQQNDGGIGLYTPVSPQSQIHPHSRTQSQSQSSISGFAPPPAGAPAVQQQQHQLQLQQPQHEYSNSLQSSLGSPFGNLPLFQQQQQGLQHAYGGGPPPAEVGLGIVANGGGGPPGLLKPRPASLSLSPSDSALKVSASATDENGAPLASRNMQMLQEEERGHMSDGEISAISKTKTRRRLFGTGSSSPHSSLKRFSKESPVGQNFVDKDKSEVGVKEKEKDKESVSSLVGKRPKSKKGTDGHDSGATPSTKGGDRLSIFGGTFTTRSRKPPPSADFEEKPAHLSKFSLGRLGSYKRSSVTPNGGGGSFIDFSPQVGSKNHSRDQSVLRKRTNSSGSAVVHNHDNVTSPVIQGSILSPPLDGASDTTPVVGDAAPAVGDNTPAIGGATPSVNGTAPAAGGATRTPQLRDQDKSGLVEDGRSILEQIGEPDHAGWMRKRGERYNSWRTRYLVLKGSHLYWMKSNSKHEKKIKGYIHVVGYKVSVDENLDPGRYGFRIDHDHDKTHCFSSDEKSVVRDWTKAIMKATIDRDYTKPVVSSCNIPTIPLTVAQAMNPAPRPPSPSARAATQKALRRDNPDQLSSRDAEILMGLSPNHSSIMESSLHQFDMSSPTSATSGSTVTTKLNSLNSLNSASAPPPPRPSREMRRQLSTSILSATEEPLIEWANVYLPPQLQIVDTPYAPLCTGLTLLRLAEAIKGKPASPPVPDSAFPVHETDDKLDGLFRLFDFLLDNDVKMGSVSINDVKCGKREKIVQLLKGLKAWDEKRRAIIQSIGKSPVQAGGFVAF